MTSLGWGSQKQEFFFFQGLPVPTDCQYGSKNYQKPVRGNGTRQWKGIKPMWNTLYYESASIPWKHCGVLWRLALTVKAYAAVMPCVKPRNDARFTTSTCKKGQKWKVLRGKRSVILPCSISQGNMGQVMCFSIKLICVHVANGRTQQKVHCNVTITLTDHFFVHHRCNGRLGIRALKCDAFLL